MIYQPIMQSQNPYYIRYTNMFSFSQHFHDEIEIIYCLKGNFRTKIDGEMYIVHENEAIISGSMCIHQYYATMENAKVLIIEFGKALLGSDFALLSEIRYKNPIFSCEDADIHRALTVLSDICRKGVEASHSIEIKACLYTIASVVKNLPASPKSEKGRGNKYASLNHIRMVLDYVGENYRNKISLWDVADLAGYEKSNFCNIFKRTTHMTFHEYLCSYRINIACNLLRDSSDSIYEIAEKVGIPCTKSFCRIFKSITEMTPTQFRNQSMLSLQRD